MRGILQGPASALSALELPRSYLEEKWRGERSSWKSFQYRIGGQFCYDSGQFSLALPEVCSDAVQTVSMSRLWWF